MIPLLRFFSWPHFLRHRLRTSLTFLGIALGVAVIVAIASVNHTLLRSFQRTIEAVAGKAVLQVTNGESGLGESFFPIIRDTEGVEDAVAAVEGFLPLTAFKGERLYIYGVDLLSDFSVREHEFVGGQLEFDRALDFIAQPDSIALTETLSQRLRLPLGSTVSLSTSRGRRNFTVRALLKERGAARVFGGSFALMDLPVAQIALGKEGKIDIVDLTVGEGQKIEDMKERLQARLQGAAQVLRPKERGEQIESMLASFRVGLLFVSLVALFVGFFLIYNTVSVSVVQRKREIGTLRCLGMVRRDILILFVLEALALALPASLLGVWGGLFLAQAALVSAGESVTNLFFQIDLTHITLTAREFLIALASGLGVTFLASLYPAWQATQVSALEGARQTVWAPQTDGPRRASLWGSLLLLLLPVALLFSQAELSPVEKFTLGVVAMLILLLGISFLCPLLILWWMRGLRRWFSRRSFFSRVESRLASDGLYRSPIRSGMTVATLMISLAAIFTISVFVHSVRESLLSWVDQMVTADLIVSSGARTAGPMNVPLREDLAGGMKIIPGVQVVDLYRLIRSTYQGRPILIESFSAQASADVRNMPMAEGDGKKALHRMAAGEGVIVSESFRSKFRKGTGETIRLPTPSGLVPFRILGIYVDYSSDSGSVLIDRALYKKIWKDELVDAVDLWLSPGADQDAVIRNIKENYGDRYQLFISTHRQLRDAVVDIMEQSFRVNYAVEIIAVVVAIFSVVNTLLASVLDRSREIGVLRAIGATQHQIRKVVMIEAGWIGFLGGILGLLSGTIMSYHHVVYNTKALTGWTFQYYYPFDVALACLALAVVLCLAAGYVPAKQAASTSIVEAIGYE